MSSKSQFFKLRRNREDYFKRIELSSPKKEDFTAGKRVIGLYE